MVAAAVEAMKHFGLEQCDENPATCKDSTSNRALNDRHFHIDPTIRDYYALSILTQSEILFTLPPLTMTPDPEHIIRLSDLKLPGNSKNTKLVCTIPGRDSDLSILTANCFLETQIKLFIETTT
jgi:hypothetical protein